MTDKHMDPEFWSEVMRESRIGVMQIARDATASGTFEAEIVGRRLNEVMDRYSTVEEQAAAMNLWAQSALGTLADTLNTLAKQQGFSSLAEAHVAATLKELSDDDS